MRKKFVVVSCALPFQTSLVIGWKYRPALLSNIKAVSRLFVKCHRSDTSPRKEVGLELVPLVDAGALGSCAKQFTVPASRAWTSKGRLQDVWQNALPRVLLAFSVTNESAAVPRCI